MSIEKQFRTSLFGGFNKKEVIEYIGRLEKEIESLKAAFEQEQEKLTREVKRGEEQRLNLKEKEQEQRMIMEAQERELKEKARERAGLAHRNQELEEQLRKLEEESREYRQDYKTLSKALADARISASYMVEKAKEDAERITRAAVREAEEAREQFEKKIEGQKKECRRQFLSAKSKIDAYAKISEEAGKRLSEARNELAALAETVAGQADELWVEQAPPAKRNLRR